MKINPDRHEEPILEKPLGRPGLLTKFLASIHPASDLGHANLVKHARHYVEKYKAQQKRIADYNSNVHSRLTRDLESKYFGAPTSDGLWRAGLRVYHPNQQNIPLKYYKVEKAYKEAERALKLYRCQNESKTSSYLQGEFHSQKNGRPFAKMPEGSRRFLERIFRELCDKKHDYSFVFISSSLTTQERVEREVLKHYEQLKAKVGPGNEETLSETLGKLAGNKDPDVDLMKLALDTVAYDATLERAS